MLIDKARDKNIDSKDEKNVHCPLDKYRFQGRSPTPSSNTPLHIFHGKGKKGQNKKKKL